MKREDGLDVLPLAMLGCDSCSSFFLWAAYHVMYLAKSFSFGEWFGFESIGGIVGFAGLYLANTVQPVFYSSGLSAQ